jgi:hypothetical protein
VVAVVCYLIEVDDLSVEEAIEYVKKRRPQINMGKIQRNICFDYYNKIHGITTPSHVHACPLLRNDSNQNGEAKEEEQYPDECCLLDDEIVQDINDEFYLL